MRHRFPLLPTVLVLLVALAAPGAMAQRPGGQASATLTGRVVDDATGEGLPSATVAVWRLPGPGGAADTTLYTGAVTDPEGAFRVEGVGAGTYRVVVSFVGYASEVVEPVEVGRGGGAVDLGTVALVADAVALEGVEVTGRREEVEVQIDRTVYRVADDAAVAGGSATDALETIPSVEVDVDGNVSLRGVQNVAILVNSRPAPVTRDFLAAYLRSLPAGALDRIEVIPNPSARYEPDGMGGIINIVLKQNTDLGLGGAVTLGGDSRGGYTATGLATYGRGPLTLSASYGLRQGYRGGDGSRFRINRYADPLTFLDQASSDEDDDFSQSLHLNLDYALTPRTTLTASSGLGLRSEEEAERTTFLELDAAERPLLSYERVGEETGDGWSADLRLGFRHDFAGDGGRREGGAGQQGGGRGGRGGGHGRRGGGTSAGLGAHTLAVEARFDASESDDATTLTEQLLGDAATVLERQRTQEGDDRREASLQVDYARPLLGLRVEAGYKGDYERLESTFFSETDTTGVFLPDLDLSNAFDFEEQIHAGYLQLGRAFGDLGVQLGLRAEYAQTTFTLQNTGEAFDNDYASLFPSAFLTYQAGDAHVFRASYSRRVSRPRTWFLNPFPSVDDPLNVRQGNPYLRPEYTDAFEVGYVHYTSFGSLTLTPYYRHTTDVIRRIQRLRDDGVTVSTFENLDTASSYGVEAIGAFSLGGPLAGLRGYASVEGFRMVTDGSSVEGDLASDAFGWGGRLNLTYAVERLGLDLQANLRYRAPMQTEQGRMGAHTFFDLALRKALLNDRASLSLRLRDPLGLAGFDGVIDQPDLYQEWERSWGAQQVGLTFQYTFGRRPQRADRERPEEGREDFEEMGM
ncbi:MAG TPA: TonB-dependent receptor [Rubricoccaceae bacterium]|nr:TonB-dependent receptor [Rubricoccaceae bacterium]